MQRITVLDIIGQEIAGITLTDADRLARRIMDLHDASVATSTSDSYDGLRWSDTIDDLIRQSKRIPAIREVRTINDNCGLKIAKDAVDARERILLY